MAEFPALPLWTDAYLADCGHLSDAEHGRYLLLLMALWRAPEQRLPNDNEWLARRFKKTVQQVETELRPLIKEFCNCDGNWVTQKRLQIEYNYLRERSKKQSDRAKGRWEKEKGPSRGNAGRHASGNAPTPTPTPTPNTPPISPPADLFETFFRTYPKRVAKGAALKAWTAATKRAEPAAIIAAASDYAATNPDPKFTPYPATWLNADRWLDERTDHANHERTQRRAAIGRAVAEVLEVSGGSAGWPAAPQTDPDGSRGFPGPLRPEDGGGGAGQGFLRLVASE